jgi:hypothetical protein
MISWRIWRALGRPPRQHPLFRRLLRRQRVKALVTIPGAAGQPLAASAAPSYSLADVVKTLAVVVGGWMACSLIWGLLGRYLLAVLYGLPLILVSFGSVYGLNIAARVSGLIADAREQNTFDLYSLTPVGPFGLSWGLSAGWLHRNDRFAQLRELIEGICILLGVIFCVMLLITMPIMLLGGAETAQLRDDYIIVGILLLAGLAAFYTDFAHSVVLALLLAMLVSCYVHRRLEAQFFTLAAFLGLQLFTYLVTLLIGFGLLPGMLSDSSSLAANIFLIVANLGLFVGLREGIIRLIWRQLAGELNVSPAEFEFMTHPALKPEVR